MRHGADGGTDTAVAALAVVDAILFQLVLRGALDLDELRLATGEGADAVRAAIGAPINDGLLAEESRGGRALVALTPAGRDRAAAVVARERRALARFVTPIDAEFGTLNRRVKQILHRWQVRVDCTTEVLNDHRDAGYDAAVLAELRAAHTAADRLLARLAPLRVRYDSLRRRLASALERAAAGDRSAVAGVTTDSFHGAWWELHADLLAVLGRVRGPGDQ